MSHPPSEPPPELRPFTETLFQEIEESGLSIRDISEKAGVPYQALRRFVKGRRGGEGRVNRTYDADAAHRVYRFLTGGEP